MKQIKLVSFLLLFLNCSDPAVRNTFSFEDSESEWFVLINGCKGSSSFEGKGERILKFPGNGILTTNIEGFKINKQDVFTFNGVEFAASSEADTGYKVCYYMASLGSGFSPQEIATTYGLKPCENMNAYQTYDFYFFRVAKNCKEGKETMDARFEKCYQYLVEHNIESAKKL